MYNLRVFRRSVIYLIAATRGGPTRVKIMCELFEKPMNPNQLAEKLNVDYKTIRHHLEVLLKNNWVTKNDQKYGETYYPAFAEDQMEIFEEFRKKLGKSIKKA